MALYLGSNGKRKVILDGVVYRLNTSITATVVDNMLLSSDNYILKDSNGIYLIPKDSVKPITNSIILSSDNYILTDSNGIYLIIKEDK